MLEHPRSIRHIWISAFFGSWLSVRRVSKKQQKQKNNRNLKRWNLSIQLPSVATGTALESDPATTGSLHVMTNSLCLCLPPHIDHIPSSIRFLFLNAKPP